MSPEEQNNGRGTGQGEKEAPELMYSCKEGENCGADNRLNWLLWQSFHANWGLWEHLSCCMGSEQVTSHVHVWDRLLNSNIFFFFESSIVFSFLI